VTAPAAAPEPEPLLTLTATEHAFFVAAADTIIPPTTFRLGQRLRGRDLHRSPARRRLWQRRAALSRRAVPEGQARARLSARADAARVLPRRIAAANDWTRKTYGKDFDRLAEKGREAALKAMDEGRRRSPAYQHHVLQRAVADHHGRLLRRPDLRRHRNMASWKMIGYPGLPATYKEDVKRYFGKKYDKPPRSIADFS